jgi:RNase H-like domain found in reverse transcriptase/Integrase zinc binding domain/Chromo (CHRromatin Organisation MOdifier) domain
MALVKKDQAFQWTKEAEQAFQQLKKEFTTGPVLATFDPSRTTIVESDSSGWCVGGALLQEGEDGRLRPCAYFSKKNSPAECNYEIYDKEMLAIVRCLQEWDAELRSVDSFLVKTDHKSLEYFMTVQKLTERQMRWSLLLSRYNFQIAYIPGKTNIRADALSRREQDMPQGADDERLRYRQVCLLPRERFQPIRVKVTRTKPQRPISTAGPAKSLIGEQDELIAAWIEAERTDETYQELCKSVREAKDRFPSRLGVKVSISECSLSREGKLEFRGRRWVPESEPLRTGIIQVTHDSIIAGHPGREVTSALLMRQFFWPGMLADVRQFVRNCDNCRSKQVWRERRQGFLKPLPIPTRMWSEISIDFIDKLPISNNCTSLMVITDRLGKGVILEPCEQITAPYVAELFIRCFYWHHGLPRAIVSDRGTQFTGGLWKRVCQLLGIVRRLSTSFHPETDGSTERMNQNVESFVRSYIDRTQEKWAWLMAPAELAINNHDAASTGVSPFFLGHGYHIEPIIIQEELHPGEGKRSPVAQGEAIVKKLQDAVEWAQAAMAVAQQTQEDQTNQAREQAPRFKVGDKVWLSLENIRTTRLSKKFDVKNAKYTVLEVMGTHTYRLDTPPGVHNVFHTRLLRLASTDRLPSQRTTDSQPQPEFVDSEPEYGIEEILDDRIVRRGRGSQKQFLVKWEGYARPTWEPALALEDTLALDAYEQQRAAPEGEGGNVTG